MPHRVKTHLICYDDFRWFTEDIRSRFDDTSRYNVISFVAVEEFMAYLEHNKDHGYCKVAILGAHDTTEQFEMISRLTGEIKKIDAKTGIILICTNDKMEEIRKIIKSNVDAYIPKNANSILRLHNAVKKLISEHGINNFRRRRNLSFYVSIGFLIIFILLVILAWFELPQYF
jgi:DNA-binding NarL/FixJ family response regulator